MAYSQAIGYRLYDLLRKGNVISLDVQNFTYDEVACEFDYTKKSRSKHYRFLQGQYFVLYLSGVVRVLVNKDAAYEQGLSVSMRSVLSKNSG